MFSPFGARSVSTYQQVGVQSVVSEASPHELIKMLFDGLLQSLNTATSALERGDIEEKIRQITKSVRILQEGLMMGLDMEKAVNLPKICWPFTTIVWSV